MKNKVAFVVLLVFLFVRSSECKFSEECAKSISQSGSDLSLSCHLRTINSEFDKTNFSELIGDAITSLNLQCSDVIFYQSSLQSESLAHLTRLTSLHIEHCKLSRLDPGVFAGLTLLKNLTIRTYNTAWPALSLEIASGVFNEMPALERIDLSANNIWTFPDKLFCPAKSLEVLNVSLNRLQDITDLSFKEKESETDRCKTQLRVLDVSSNRLIVLPSRSLLALTNLQELYLQANEISNIQDRALTNLRALRILNLSGNKIVAIPKDLFADAKEITEIYLQNNSLTSVAPGLFSNLNQLAVLDLSHNLLTSDWMNASGAFRGLIRLVFLRLGYNRLSHLNPEAFADLYSLQILSMEHNTIQVIDGNTFSAMNNLHTLILSHNKLQFIDATALNGLFVLSTLSLDNNAITGIHPAAFHNCSSLKDLNLNGNAFSEIPGALQNLTLLKMVDLGENTIEQLETPRLVGMKDLYGLRLTGNRIVNVSKDALKGLPALKVLNLARNRIQSVEPGSFDNNTNLQAVRLDANYLGDISNLFAQAPNLIWLNISDNHLTWFDYALIPKQLQWLDLHKNGITDLGNYFNTEDLRLSTLDVSFNRISKISAQNVPDSLENLFLNDNLISNVEPHTFYKKVNLSRVDIFANQIETMDLKALQLAPFPQEKPLPEFYIAGNPILCDCNMEWLQRINSLDHLRQHPRVMDLDSVYCKLVYHRDKYFVPLADANAHQFLCSYRTHCFALCHCCEFDACDCQMTCPQNCTCYHDDTWSANIVDCASKDHLTIPQRIPMDSTEIYLDGNVFPELTSHVFIGRKNLKVLYLNNSGIRVVQNNSFSGLKRLEILHLENNYLDALEGYEFEPLESLRELYLQSNALSYIENGTFAGLKNLEVLKLDGNSLTRFSIWSLSGNPYLVEIALGGNPWSCDCGYVAQAAAWIQANKAKLMDASGVNCVLNGRPFSLVYVSSNGTKCAEITALSGAVEAPENSILSSYLPLVAGVMAVCLLLGSVLVALCRKRNSLRIWAVSKCPLQCYQTTLEDDREKLYDAYVAYSVKDEAWVGQVLAAELGAQNITSSGSTENGYRLCLHYKDFPVSAYIADTIVEAVESSRRTIIVLSKNFLQSEWCRFEFKSALHAALRGKKNRLIAVMLGDLPTRDLDPDLRVCLRSATVLNSNDKLFWAKLRCALPEPRLGALVLNRRSNGAMTLPLHGNGSFGGGTLGSPIFPPPPPPAHNGGIMTMTHSNSSNVQLYVPPFPPPNRPPPPFPAPRRPPPPAPLWA
ncbi:unnamed protein product [Allacma fusca]|uniref:TIR domain-containing protein n=1 Tax=Allacma fusca TaxID=39272 RepID=A0A8J2LZ16_9HEXA|nr:unnamed protein product [Allacma fusca]